ncbi:MAG TPA: glycosyltransferase family 4 protein [Patescibacteria group bacterium]|nr:glycosyltransferase family 4 protein [Patescibacteria group bacterium]
MKNRKILIATGIYPPDIGGPATILEALSAELISRGYEVGVLTYSDVSRQVDDKPYVYRVKKGKFYSHLIYFFKMLTLALWCDLIYVTDTYSVGRFAYLMKKIIGKKYILRFAGDSAWEMAVASGQTTDYIVDFEDNKYDFKIEATKDRRRKIMTGADGVIAVSNFMAGLAEKIGVGRHNIRTIYNSIDFINNDVAVEKVREIRNRYGNDTKIIATACRLMPWKGVDGIIRIMNKLFSEFGRVNLLVLGDGPELDNLKELAKASQVDKRVHFLGKISHNQVSAYYQAIDLFILNTNYEGLSHTLLEVMKAGTPVVATNVGGNPELIASGQDGLLVEYNNDEQLFLAVKKILSDNVVGDNMVKSANEKLKKFNWENTIFETVRLINEI